MKKIICAVVVLFITTISMAQNDGKKGLVQGTITDALNFGKLSGAQISLPGSSIGSHTQ